MSLHFKYIGWSTENSSDKIWGVIYLEPMPDRDQSVWGSIYTYKHVVVFWGRRNKKMQHKISLDDYSLEKTLTKKKESYTEITIDNLDPECIADLEKAAMWAMLKI